MKKGIWILTGFVLFINGMVALILTLVGVKLAYLRWLDEIGPLFGFVAKFVMVLAGILIIILASTDWRREKELLDQEEYSSSK